MPLVLVSQDDDDDSTLSTYSFSPPASVTPPSNKTSSPVPGTPKFAGLFIEGKKDNTTESILKLQLWANMVAATQLQSSTAKYKSHN